MDCVIDTNVLIEYILLESDMHEEAGKGLGRIDVGVVPSVVMGELVRVMTRMGMSKSTINKKLDEVLGSYTIVEPGIDGILWAKEAIMKEKNESFRRFGDKLILSVAKSGNLPLFTFDKALIKECKENGVMLLHE